MASQATFYIRPLFQNWEMQQTYLIHRNTESQTKQGSRGICSKEQNQTSEKEPEISYLSDKEFKVTVIMMFTKFERMDEHTRTSINRLKI